MSRLTLAARHVTKQLSAIGQTVMAGRSVEKFGTRPDALGIHCHKQSGMTMECFERYDSNISSIYRDSQLAVSKLLRLDYLQLTAGPAVTTVPVQQCNQLGEQNAA